MTAWKLVLLPTERGEKIPIIMPCTNAHVLGLSRLDLLLLSLEEFVGTLEPNASGRFPLSLTYASAVRMAVVGSTRACVGIALHQMHHRRRRVLPYRRSGSACHVRSHLLTVNTIVDIRAAKSGALVATSVGHQWEGGGTRPKRSCRRRERVRGLLSAICGGDRAAQCHYAQVTLYL